MNVEQLKLYDYTLIIDKSGSMATKDAPGGKSRWAFARENTFGIASKVEEWHPTGMAVYTFNDTFKRYDNVVAATVDQIWNENDPAGGTNLADVLHDAFSNYLTRKKAGKTKTGEIIVVVTDGQPQDQNAVADQISAFTQKLDSDEEFGIEFIQIGHDPSAAAFLHFLDVGLEAKGAKFDIVNSTTAEEAASISYVDLLTKAVLE